MIRRAPKWAVLLSLLSISLSGCGSDSEGHDHASQHPGGRDHHEEGHGHGDVATISRTLWSEGYELFAEYQPGITGQNTSFLLHLTELGHFRALENATLKLAFVGPEPLSVETSTTIKPGFFLLSLPAGRVGKYSGTLTIIRQNHGQEDIAGIDFEVFTDSAAANASVKEAAHQGLIEFLKEQQWGVPFMTEFTTESSLVASVEVSGRVDTPPGGRAEVGVPLAGLLIAPTEGLARPGTTVKKGDVLARLAPTLSSPEAAAKASLVVAEAEARASAAQAGLTRAKRLIVDEAISQRELEDARRESQVAKESVRAARRAARLYSSGRQSGGSQPLRAPIDGTVVSVFAKPGSTVRAGEVLFEIINTEELWIVAQVPEQEAATLRAEGNASFKIAGSSDWQTIDISAPDGNASLVTIAPTVNPQTRTVEVMYSLTNPDKALRVGGLLQVSLSVGDQYTGIVVPQSALVNQEGRDMVYVQVDGEHFQERLVRVGPRSGGMLAIREGLQKGERIVTQGAHLVRLADRANNSAPAHGHVH